MGAVTPQAARHRGSNPKNKQCRQGDHWVRWQAVGPTGASLVPF